MATEESAKLPDTAEVTKDVLAPADGPRENLISTAVKFLQNPKVHQSPLYQKKAFLEKKGLTKEEIDIAVQRSGIEEGTSLPHQSQQPQYPPGPFQQVLVPPQPVALPTAWSRARDFTTTAVIVTSISYAVYRLYQLYIHPWLLGKAASDESRMERLEKRLDEIQSLNETMARVQTTLSNIQDSLCAQQASLSVLSQKTIHSQSLAPGSDNNLLQDVKSEVSSLKGLLLSRRQFPPMPQTTPVLPSWQLTSSSVASIDSSASQSNEALTSSSQTNQTESSPSSDSFAAASDHVEESAKGDNPLNREFTPTGDSEPSATVSTTESSNQSQTAEIEVKGHEPHSDDTDKVKETTEDVHLEQAVSASS